MIATAGRNLPPAMGDQAREKIHERIFGNEAAFDERPHFVEPVAGDHLRMQRRIDESDPLQLAPVRGILQSLRQLLLNVRERGLQFGCAKIVLERKQRLQLIPGPDMAQLDERGDDASPI